MAPRRNAVDPIVKNAQRFTFLLAVGVGTLYTAALFTLYVSQRFLLYVPNSARPSPTQGVVEVELTAKDGVRLYAWTTDDNPSRSALLLHGNGGNRANVMDAFRGFERLGFRPLVLDYRGYGGSEGSPSEEGLYHDAEAAFQWLLETGAEELVVWAYSLGSGVAVHVGARHKIDALILDAPFDSLVSVASVHYPWFPVSLLLTDRFDSAAKIADIECPLLIVHGEHDRTIPIRHGRALFRSARKPKRFEAFPNTGHNNIRGVFRERYWTAVEATVKRGEKPPGYE